MFAVISLSPLYFLGLGLLLTPKTDDLWESLFRYLTAGLLINHFLILVSESLSFATLLGLALSLAGFIRFATQKYRWPRPTIFSAVFVVVAGTLYFWRGLFDPISGYDPLSFWFLQSKEIFISKALRFEFLGQQNLAYVHLDYPKLIPALSAQFCNIAGYWNDALAKTSFANLLLAAIFGLASFARRRADFILTVFGLLLFAGENLWGSYVDGYLALYAGIGGLFCARALRGSGKGDIGTGLLALGMAANLKNEGVVLLLAGVLALVVCRRKFLSGYWLPLSLIFATVGVWAFWKRVWHLPSDLSFGADSLQRALVRIQNAETYQLLWLHLVRTPQLGRVLLLVVACFAVGRAWRDRACRFTLLFVALYFGSLLFVYLSTPHALDWHLRTSAYRTILPIMALLFGCAALALEDRSFSEPPA